MVFKNNNTVFLYMKRIICLILIILFVSVSAIYAQKTRNEAPPFKERLFYGGSFGLQLGTITNIELSPVIGFWVLPRLAIAVGPNYQFYKVASVWTDIYGGRAYTEFVVIQDISSIIPIGSNTGIFLHCENELLSLQSSFWKDPPITSKRFFVNTVLAGVGISQRIGRRSSLNMMALWALNDSLYGIYSNPEFRITYTF
jgi:hypothetical protein